jgi:class 3 adenylate cyclase
MTAARQRLRRGKPAMYHRRAALLATCIRRVRTLEAAVLLIHERKMPTTQPTQPKATQQELPWQGRLYALRVLFTTMVLLVLVGNDAACHDEPSAHIWLVLIGALYPHIGHLLLGRFEGRGRGAYAIIVVDSFFSGAVIAAIGLASAPSAVLAAINLFNCMVVGGPALIALGMVAGLLGIALSGVAALPPSTSICGASDALAGVLLVGYFFVVGRFIHYHIGRLRQQHAQLQAESDAAARARFAADRALAAVLPPSAAEVLVERGEVPTETLDAATILMVEFGWEHAESQSIASLGDSFQICDAIIGRHGFECIKTFGPRYLALSRAQTGPDDAVATAKELSNYLRDHGRFPGSPFRQRCVRVFIHCGTITAGLVQPSRLNYEILGEPMEVMHALAGFACDQPMGNVIVSAAAQRRMQKPADFVATQAEPNPAAYVFRLAPSP